MRNLALVICSEKKEEGINNKSIFSKLRSMAARNFSKKKEDYKIQLVNLGDDVNLGVIKLPFTIEELCETNKKKIDKFIQNVVSENNIDNCIVSPKISENCIIEGCIESSFNGRLLFKSLFSYVLEKIYIKQGIDLSNMDVSIICGDVTNELYATIEELCEIVKYITICTANKESVESIIDVFYENYGLSVGVVCSGRLALKDADLVILLEGFDKGFLNQSINKKAVILNLSNGDIGSTVCTNVLINGVEVGIPADISEVVGKEVFYYFSKEELAEILLVWTALGKCSLFDSELDQKTAEEIARQFILKGFRITAFMGRHGKLEARDLKACI